MPFLLKWPARVTPATSDALVSQVDLMGSLAALTDATLQAGEGPDSFNELPALLGEDAAGREYLIEHNSAGTLSIIKDGWKYIEPSQARPYNANTDIELGNNTEPQLYHLMENVDEQHNLAEENEAMRISLVSLLETVKAQNQTRPE